MNLKGRDITIVFSKRDACGLTGQYVWTGIVTEQKDFMVKIEGDWVNISRANYVRENKL